MTRSPRFLAAAALLAAFMAALATLGGRGGQGDNDSYDFPPRPAVNRIAVVGTDAQVRTYAPDGSDARDISSGDGFFTWPTWSPDAQSVVFSGVTPDAAGGGGAPTISLLEYDRREGETRVVHRPAPGFAGLLANGVVHYPIWSPDSSKLAFVAVTRERGLALYLYDARAPDAEPKFVLDEGPLWTVWASDSERLLVHRGADHFIVRADDGAAERLPIEPSPYRVPAWKPPSDTPTAIVPTGGRGYAIRELAPQPPSSGGGVDVGAAIARVGANAAFSWSADGARLAIADGATPILYRGSAMLVYRRLTALDASAPTPTARVFGSLLAHFWSPDGAKIAYVEIADASGRLRWRLLDAASGESSDLAEFAPSPDQLTMFQFFDQYAYSHSLWSPDSRHLVFAGRLSDAASAASWSAQPRESRVYVLDTGPTRAAQAIADGVLGVWSPR